MAVLDPNEIMFKAFEPKVQNRFVMYIDNIPSFMVRVSSEQHIQMAPTSVYKTGAMGRMKKKRAAGAKE